MWASVQSAITSANDDPLAAGNAILDGALGPSFDYLQTIDSPAKLNVGDQGTLDQVGTNANAINTYFHFRDFLKRCHQIYVVGLELDTQL